MKKLILVFLIMITLGSALLIFINKPFQSFSSLPNLTIDTFCVHCTTYSPTKEQCGNDKGITHSGLVISKPERWVALSPDLLKEFPHLTTIYIEIPLAPQLNGEYMVTDKTSNRFKNRVDFMISNPNQFRCEFSLPGYIIVHRWD